MKTIQYADLPSVVGQELGDSDWLEITQEAVNAFAEVTHDHQWIHTDPERAAKESPFGGPIAHGYFTLSLVSYLTAQMWSVAGVSYAVNYGLNKVRFPHPVRVGSRIRAHGKVESIEAVKGGCQCVVVITVEVEGAAKPACVAEAVFRYYQ